MDKLAAKYKGKHVLVTGGAGFIGSHITERLVSLGAKVTILDNFSSGKLSNIKDVATMVNIIYGDVRSSYSCDKATRGQTLVFHTAAFISVPLSVENPQICHDVNALGTENLLKASVKNGVEKFIFSSSAAVYGQRGTKCKETDKISPESPYAKSKAKAENYCIQYSQKKDLYTIILRYFNVYGNRQNSNGQYASVVAKFKKNLIEQKPISIYGDGKQERDFIEVSKVVDANLKIALTNNFSGNIFNIASGKSINLLGLLKKLENETKIKRTNLIYKEMRPGDIFTSRADCSKFNLIQNQQN